jgi:hypothetical protein
LACASSCATKTDKFRFREGRNRGGMGSIEDRYARLYKACKYRLI